MKFSRILEPQVVLSPRVHRRSLTASGMPVSGAAFPAAIRAYEESLALEPNNSEAYFDMGVAYSEMGDYQKALEYIAKAITLDPENGRYHYGRAWSLILAGRTAEAEADMMKAASYGNLDAQSYLQR